MRALRMLVLMLSRPVHYPSCSCCASMTLDRRSFLLEQGTNCHPGMLASAETIDVIAKRITKHNLSNLVLDPVRAHIHFSQSHYGSN